MHVTIDTAVIATARIGTETGTGMRAATDPATRGATVRATMQARAGPILRHRSNGHQPGPISHLAPRRRFALTRVDRSRVALIRPALTRPALTQPALRWAAKNRVRVRTLRLAARVVSVAAAVDGGAVVVAAAPAGARVALNRVVLNKVARSRVARTRPKGQTEPAARVLPHPPLPRPSKGQRGRLRHQLQRPSLRPTGPRAARLLTSMWCGLRHRAKFSVRGPKKGNRRVCEVCVSAAAAQAQK